MLTCLWNVCVYISVQVCEFLSFVVHLNASIFISSQHSLFLYAFLLRFTQFHIYVHFPNIANNYKKIYQSAFNFSQKWRILANAHRILNCTNLCAVDCWLDEVLYDEKHATIKYDQISQKNPRKNISFRIQHLKLLKMTKIYFYSISYRKKEKTFDLVSLNFNLTENYSKFDMIIVNNAI